MIPGSVVDRLTLQTSLRRFVDLKLNFANHQINKDTLLFILIMQNCFLEFIWPAKESNFLLSAGFELLITTHFSDSVYEPSVL